MKNTACAQRMLKENEVKIFKKRKMAKNDFSRSDLGSYGVVLAIFGVPEMALRVPESKL